MTDSTSAPHESSATFPVGDSAPHEPFLGKLAARSGLDETFATAALGVSLHDSALRQAVLDFLGRRLGIDLSEVTKLRTEVDHRNFGRTDLEGQSANGRPFLIIEAKFGASLTDGQIIRYVSLQREEVRDSVTGLVLLVPDARLEQVAHQAERVARDAGHDVHIEAVSWTELLDEMDRIAQNFAQGPRSIAADLAQLRALVDARTRLVVPALGSAALGPEWVARRGELHDVVDFATQQLAEQLDCYRGPRVAGANVTFAPAYYLKVSGPVPETFVAVGLNSVFASEGLTPLWIRFHKVTGGRDAVPAIRARLQASQYAATWRNDGGHAWIPIELDPVLADNALIDDCVRQATEIIDFVASQ